jgi:hypothetical protein
MTDLPIHARYQVIAQDQSTDLKTIWIDLSDGNVGAAAD